MTHTTSGVVHMSSIKLDRAPIGQSLNWFNDWTDPTSHILAKAGRVMTHTTSGVVHMSSFKLDGSPNGQSLNWFNDWTDSTHWVFGQKCICHKREIYEGGLELVYFFCFCIKTIK